MLTVTVITSELRLPLASTVDTVMTLSPGCSGTSRIVQKFVPAAVPLPPRLFTQVTAWSGASSVAAPPSVMNEIADVVAGAEVGVAIVTFGSAPRVSKTSSASISE